MISRLRGALRGAGFVLVTVPLMPVQQLFVWFWPALARWFPHFYHRMVCHILGVRVDVDGHVPMNGPCLLVANHVSWLDIVVLSAVVPVSFVAKREVAGWPLFGTLARLQRTVFVDRERRHKTASHRDELAERLKQKDILVLFPEGTSGDGATVLPFKSSFFAAATDPAISLVPVSIAYTHGWNLPLTRRNRPLFAWYGDMELLPHLWEALCAGPLRVCVRFHSPLPDEVGGERKRAAAEAERLVREGLAVALHAGPVLR